MSAARSATACARTSASTSVITTAAVRSRVAATRSNAAGGMCGRDRGARRRRARRHGPRRQAGSSGRRYTGPVASADGAAGRGPHRARRPRVHRGTPLARRSAVVQRHARPPGLSTTLDGDATPIVRVDDDEPSGLGWLPDGRLLVVAMETQRLLRLEPDGELVVHADLSSAARGSLNDMIVAADGTAYLGDMGVRIHELGSERRPGQTFRVAPRRHVGVRGRRPRVAQRPHPHRRRSHADRGRERRRAPHRVHRARRRHAHRPPHLRRAHARARRRGLRPARRHLPRRRGCGVGRRPVGRARVPRARGRRGHRLDRLHHRRASRSRACSAAPTAARC